MVQNWPEKVNVFREMIASLSLVLGPGLVMQFFCIFGFIGGTAGRARTDQIMYLIQSCKSVRKDDALDAPFLDGSRT